MIVLINTFPAYIQLRIKRNFHPFNIIGVFELYFIKQNKINSLKIIHSPKKPQSRLKHNSATL